MLRAFFACSIVIVGCSSSSFEVTEVADTSTETSAETSVTDSGSATDSGSTTDATIDSTHDTTVVETGVVDVGPSDAVVTTDTRADALPCSTPISCWSDADGDGYAPATAILVSACECPKNTTSRNPASSVDCNDDDPRVHPGATAWQVDPYCVPGTGCATKSFDYDCSGAEERQYPTSFSSCTASPCGGAGWSGPAPGCGASAPWTFCKLDLVVCNKDSSTSQKQGCR